MKKLDTRMLLFLAVAGVVGYALWKHTKTPAPTAVLPAAGAASGQQAYWI